MVVQNKTARVSAKAIIDSLSRALMLSPNQDLNKGLDTNISAYGEFECNGKTVLIRVSDHNTFLYNWINKNESIDLQMSANYAITFVDKVPFKTNPNKENRVKGQSPAVITVRQYIYYCEKLSWEEAELVMSACIVRKNHRRKKL